ncbi:endonuclease/exonuclease/phosphatase family protein, partial [uncultured Bacteroides sp.]|uniref:endonuclease/exonuclease/phosphatase family protein n=1 Tax=uncultured Bacteroides sp. TaxID=162156 RepID=UPI00344EC14E
MKYLVSLLLVLLASSTLQADDTIHINFMAYNVENFFDCQHDTLKDDWAFTPKGANRWTPERYRRKAENIARVIVAAGGWNPPALVALCEVENERVINTLCDQLKVLDYSYFITHSHDRRGIDVALLYRTEYFTPLQSRSISITPTSTEQRPTRDILHVSGRLADCRDTLDLFICHFPSRSGGARKTEGYRLQAARTLKQAADSVARQRQSPCLLIMGDFNDSP